jgi:hypothetical protein
MSIKIITPSPLMGEERKGEKSMEKLPSPFSPSPNPSHRGRGIF